MTVLSRVSQFLLVGIVSLGLSTHAVASNKVENALLGAGLGAAAGAVLSEGDPLITLGGAATGGVLGHVLTNDRKKSKRHGWQAHNHYRQAAYRHNNGRHLGHYKNKKHKKHSKHKKRYRR